MNLLDRLLQTHRHRRLKSINPIHLNYSRYFRQQNLWALWFYLHKRNKIWCYHRNNFHWLLLDFMRDCEIRQRNWVKTNRSAGFVCSKCLLRWISVPLDFWSYRVCSTKLKKYLSEKLTVSIVYVDIISNWLWSKE